MANEKISEMSPASTPLTGAELIPMVQGGANVKGAVSDLWAGQYAQFQYRENAGVDGAALSAAVYNKVPLNTTVANNITGASISNNVVTLPAGTYQVMAFVSAGAAQKRPRIRDTSNNTTLVLGTSVSTNVPTRVLFPGILSGRCSLLAEATIELQMYSNEEGASILYGFDANSGEPEVYAQLEIWKLA